MSEPIAATMGGRGLFAVSLWAVVGLGSLLPLLSLGCISDPEPAEVVQREDAPERTGSTLEDRARSIFESESFQRYLSPTPRPDGELLDVTLVRVTDTGRQRDAYDLGYVREERLVFVLPDRPWEARDETQIDIRTADVFPHPVEQPDGSLVLYQAVERRLITILDLAGQPVGTIDDAGRIYRFRQRDARLELIGYGSPQHAVELLFEIRSRHQIDSETFQAVSVEPQVLLVPLDGDRAQQRLDRTLSEGLVRRGRDRLGEGMLREAMEDFEQAVALDPAYVEAYVARAEGHQANRDYEAALADYDRAVARDEERWDVWVARALVLTEMRRIPDAHDSIREAYRWVPDDALTEVRLAEERVENARR